MLSAIDTSQVQIRLKWRDNQKIPEKQTEFFYILTQENIGDKIESDKSEFDKSYFIEYFADTTEFINGLNLGNLIYIVSSQTLV